MNRAVLACIILYTAHKTTFVKIILSIFTSNLLKYVKNESTLFLDKPVSDTRGN